jgi:hypothetical protein
MHHPSRRINYWALATAAVAAFVVSSLWYSPALFGNAFVALSGIPADFSPHPAKIALELLRTFIVALVVVRLGVLEGAGSWRSAVQRGIGLWVGFPVILLTGSVLWQNESWALAGIHAGDWLVKILLIFLIVTLWPKGRSAPAAAHLA